MPFTEHISGSRPGGEVAEQRSKVTDSNCLHVAYLSPLGNITAQNLRLGPYS